MKYIAYSFLDYTKDKESATIKARTRKGDIMNKKLFATVASLLLAMNTAPLTVVANTTSEEITSLNAQIEALEKQVEASLLKDNGTSVDIDKLGSRAQPVPLGQAVRITQKEWSSEGQASSVYELKLEEFKRGAEATKLLDQLAYYSEATDDEEWVVMKWHMNYLEGDENTPLTTNMYYKLFDYSGKEIRQRYEHYADFRTDDAFEGQSMFPPNEHTGYVAFVVPKGSEFLFAYDTFERKYFFSTEQNVSEETLKLMNELAQLKHTYTEKVQTLWGQKDYPVPFGEPITIEEAVTTTGNQEITVTYSYKLFDVARGEEALNVLTQFAPDIAALPQGKEWVLLAMEMEYLEDYSNTPFFSIASTQIVTESGMVIPQTEHYLLRDFRFESLLKGAYSQAAIAFQIPKGDSFQFIYDVELERYYFDGQKQ